MMMGGENGKMRQDLPDVFFCAIFDEL